MNIVAAPPVPFELPDAAFDGVGQRPFGVYVHVPFCATRCGYCDFNTYTAGELGTSASPQSWREAMRRELEAAASLLADRAGVVPTADTVFVGGGTPSLLGGDGLTDVLNAVRASFGLTPGAEVTTESNPESTSPEFFDALLSAGFTRVSLGMQSAAPHVLRVLDRTHTPGRAVAAAREAKAAGFGHVNLDLIYGTPGERPEDLDSSLDAVLTAGVDHVSAYALIVEDGTAMARKVRRGELPMPDDDVLAARYERIDSVLSGAGLSWYEVSNWASDADAECKHNVGYWDGGDWWGAGPGAHSHVGGTRFWNVKHPARYADQLASGAFPVAGSELLTREDRHLEELMLKIRLRTGLPADVLDVDERHAADQVVADGLMTFDDGRFVLTDRGRLLADAVVRSIAA
ncbi:coproporphyrinogen III oxidase [Rhodococcus sp. BP-252]|uniref:radical SAM family heme chaperone HemW n=1 Tax=unclassified Rhodococcus (in: high G+C Gram-positive bacteria) TaxID=192944 RepID=UPI001C9B0549|nr:MULTISPECIES: radical SAM family heme chaperone HemW [unclassified Rhodococcus (in: high G+C Gram-positive bacteria)]MBY6412037.1 coproporphyrinogen III oxidase [Rhodococcus sp. BP-320]MBY6416617.1 coproporphyrinogen III oxidase [Rhodococcus sp. BP-321]MBY6421194.1 coproporphyrinogen III oxidase [Rhodococcus sp. BP-324]MBY6426641.1 coproporphyrinogen III oxidase [Rhodococcus sp. BP-323]MBY6431640.1 coproporphyrinogen III oxidase [Rhodococcus sp. BP-322]